MKPLPTLYLLGRIADVGLTAAILHRGGIELNPLWAGVYLHGWSFALGLQVVACAPIAAIARRLPFAWVPLLLASWIPVAWNLHQF